MGRIRKAFGLKPQLVDASRSATTRSSLTMSAMWWGCVWIRRKKRWCSASTRCPDSSPGPPSAGAAEDARAARAAHHDYLRHGITTLFAALHVATGEIYGSIHRRHRASEFKESLASLNGQIPELDVHLICDNTPPTRRRQSPHGLPPVLVSTHFTPTYSSCLNQVERWFALVSDKKLRRGATPVNPGPGERHSRLDRHPERQPETLHLDQNRR
jgi:transposase